MQGSQSSSSSTSAEASFYDVLGAFPEATPSQIRQAYRKAARRWHPDKVHTADKALAERRFKEVAEAYEVLNDGKQRRIYDLYLRCRPFGYLEVADPEDPTGPGMQVPVKRWSDFKQLFSNGTLQAGGWAGEDGRRYEEDEDGSDGGPITVLEWILAGGVVVALWWWAAWRFQRHLWLSELPAHIWRIHSEFSMPMGLLLAPLFFGNVPFREAMEWMHSTLESVEDV